MSPIDPPTETHACSHRETVFIVDDDPSVRDAVTLLLSLRGHACAAFASAEDFLSALQPTWRGCVVADIRMAGMSGLRLQALLREQRLPLPVIVITAHGDVAAARQAFKADAVDFLEKPFDTEQLLAAVDTALAGPQPHMAARSSPLAGGSTPARSEPAARQAPEPGRPEDWPMLSPREHEVMQLLAQGMPNRRIATELGISHRTVEVHKARVLDKLRVHSVVELVRLFDSKLDR